MGRNPNLTCARDAGKPPRIVPVYEYTTNPEEWRDSIERLVEFVTLPIKGSMAITCNYTVTFEYDRQPPKTHRGTVTAAQAHTLVRAATREAFKTLKPYGWSSLVCVLLDRADQGGTEGAEVIPDDAPDV